MGQGGVRREGRGLSIRPTLACHSREGVPSESRSRKYSRGCCPLLQQLLHTSFRYLPSLPGILPSVSRHLCRASLPPARASRIASRSRACISDSPSSGAGHPPAPPSPDPALRPVPVSPAAPVCGDAPDASGSRPPARPPSSGSGFARVPAARPPLTARFREPGRPPAAAMLGSSRDVGAPPRPRPRPAFRPQPGAALREPRWERGRGLREVAVAAAPGAVSPPARLVTRACLRCLPEIKAHVLFHCLGKMPGMPLPKELRCPEPRWFASATVDLQARSRCCPDT